MIDFFITLFFVGAMVCLLAIPLVITFLFVRGYDWPSRKKYLLQLTGLLVGFLLCLIISGRIYNASLTPEQRAEFSQQATPAAQETIPEQ